MARKPRNPQVMIELLEKYGPDFMQNGSLVYRNEPGRRPCWCLRFRVKEPVSNKVCQRSIYLGTNPAVADNVGHFLATQRQKRVIARQKAKERSRQEREVKRQRRVENKEYLNVLIQAHNYSIRAKKRIRSLVSGKNQDLGELTRLSIGGRLRTRRRGRPLRNRLW